jgi:UDP-glucose 4-epimerase
VLELYTLCREAAGADVEADHAPERPGELQRSVVDISLAERELGWRPERELADGLRETWAWISRAST